MTDADKKIAKLEKEVETLKKQLAQAVRGLTAMERKLNRVYHSNQSLSGQVQAIAHNQRRQQ